MINAGEFINEVATLLGDANKSYHTQANMLTYLNLALKDTANRARCIQRERYYASVSGKYQYALPEDFIRAEVVAYSDGQFYPLDDAKLEGIIGSRYWIQSGSSPEAYDVWGNSHIQRATGTATGGSTTSLIDTAKTFNSGDNRVYVGDLVFNLTDDSEATVTGLTGANQVDFSGNLAGGSDNTFAAGDTYEIVSPNAPRKTLVIHPAPGTTATTGTENIAIFYSAKHRVMTQAQIDAGNDGMEIDEELELPLRHRLMYYARVEEFGEESPQAKTQQTDYLTEYYRALPAVRRRIRKYRTTWMKRLVGRRARTMGNAPSYTYPWNQVDIL